MKIIQEMLRYSLAGVLATVADFGLLYILKENFAWHYMWAGAAAFIVGSTVSYVLSVNFVFPGYYQKKLYIPLVAGFFLISFIGLFINELFMWFVVSKLDQHYLVAKLIAVIAVTTWNFSAKKWMLFNAETASRLEKQPII